MLFEDLRNRVSRIEGLVEDLGYSGPALGWGPCYRVGEKTLFNARILPGVLEASIELDPRLREHLLRSPKSAKTIRGRGWGVSEVAVLRVRLRNLEDVRAWASLAIMKNRLWERS